MEQQTEARLGEVQSESRELAIPDEEKEVVAGILESPLMVTDGAGNEIELNRARFIRYYLPKGATEEEIFHCYQQTRATGLNPMIPGECHYFKTGGGPMRLYTGYPVYLKKAYAAGLQHIQKPEITFDENGKPLECTITLQIAGRPDFSWTTWFDEVKSVDANGKLNKRWMKAGIFQFIKCSVVNTLRWSGLVDFSLPYIVEEMGDPVAEGYRTLTQEQLDAHEPEEATMGEVTAANHQIDTGDLRRRYFATLNELRLLMDETDRYIWQLEVIKKEHVSGWEIAHYALAFHEIATGGLQRWINDRNLHESTEDERELTPDDMHGEVEKIVKEVYADSVKAPESDTDPSGDGMTKEGEEEPQEQGKEVTDKAMEAWRGTPIRDPQVHQIRELMDEVPAFAGLGFINTEFTEFMEDCLGKEVPTVRSLLYEDGRKLIDALEKKIAGDDNTEAPDEPFLVTKETYGAIKDVLIKFPGHRYLTIKSRAFKERAGGIIGSSFTSLKSVLETDAQDILNELKNECLEAVEAQAQGEAKVNG